MKFELPDNFRTARGMLGCSTTDTGDHHVVFLVEPEDFEIAREGVLAGMIIPGYVGEQHLDQIIREIRDAGGIRFIIVPRSAS